MDRFTRRQYILSATTLCVGVIIGLITGHLFWDSRELTNNSLKQVRADLTQYNFINPTLFTDVAKSNDPTLKTFASDVGSYIDLAKTNGSLDSASVYFRDLNSSRWIGVNEDALYTPSSMLKVIGMMAALKVAEQDPSILSKKLYYHKSPKSNETFPANDALTDGYYSLQELIGAMIKYSDNDAFNAITSDQQINAEFAQTYSIFRLPPSGITGTTRDFMSPKSFSVVFRTLYNSSFFQWTLSEQVLDLLSQTTWKDGLVSGVPAGTIVSHKFGENTNELHDCGIIYYPGHPYLLCIMTRGSDVLKLESVIQGISKLAWNLAEKLNPSNM